jgi:hypothetical protein
MRELFHDIEADPQSQEALKEAVLAKLAQIAAQRRQQSQ